MREFLNEELEEIKETVIKYPGNIGIEVVIGSDHLDMIRRLKL
jgi:antibiotic biosynthesis monooxygenase (ABM) superfamily enzyme